VGDTAVAPPNISQPPTRTAIGVPRRLASSFPAPPRPTQSRERGPGCAAPSARPHSSSATAPLRSSARGLEPATSSYALARAESYGGTDTESVPLRRPKHPSHSIKKPPSRSLHESSLCRPHSLVFSFPPSLSVPLRAKP
jgi:hypothetical protein